MKTTELRILNYVYYRDKVRKIIAIFNEQRNSIELEGYKTRIDLLRYNPPTPIALTEQWLKDAGFEWNEVMDGWLIDDFFINKSTEESVCIGFVDWGINLNYIKLHYVHSLQNLYFALAEKELTITKPNKD